jgi:hypothetical protein
MLMNGMALTIMFNHTVVMEDVDIGMGTFGSFLMEIATKTSL